MEQDRKYRDMAPGLTQTIEAGEELVMRDAAQNEFSVGAKLDGKTAAFVNAFDAWYVLKNSGTGSSVRDALWADVERTFEDLSPHVVGTLIWNKTAGIIVPGHGHA